MEIGMGAGMERLGLRMNRWIRGWKWGKYA